MNLPALRGAPACALSVFALSTSGCFPQTQVLPADDAAYDACGVTVDATWPLDGSSDFYYRDTLEFTFSDADSEATVVAPFSGTELWSEDGKTLQFVPDAPLTPATGYAVSLDYCGGQPDVSFWTSELGLPLEDADALVGATYAVDLRDAEFTAGGSLGEALASFLGVPLLVQVLDTSAPSEGSLALRFALALDDDGGEQDPCGRTIDVEGIDFDDAPTMAFTTESMVFDAFEGTLDLMQLGLDATFAADGEKLGGLRFDIVLDAQDLAAVADVEGDAICDLAEVLGTECAPCPDGGMASCLTISAARLDADRVDVDIEQVDDWGELPECEDA